MNTKQQISNLLYEISCYACAESIREASDAVQDALDAGVFDCLVEHPASEPPPSGTRALIEYGDNDFCVAVRMGDTWMGPMTTILTDIVSWWELPVSEETE